MSQVAHAAIAAVRQTAETNGDLFAGNFVTVYDGASLYINNKATSGSAMCNNKNFFLNGHGCAAAAVNGVTGAMQG